MVIIQAGNQRLPGLAAEMAFNVMLALFPAILTVLTAIGLITSSEAAFQQLAIQLGQVAPDEVVDLVQNFIQEIHTAHNQQLLSISFIASFWISSGAISAAMNALDHIYQIPQKQRRPFWKAKLVSLHLTFGTILLLMVASTLVFISDLLVQLIVVRSGVIANGLLQLWHLFSYPLALGIVAIAFAFIYRYGASHWTMGTPILPGAILAALFWALFSSLFRLYVSHFGSYNRVYGAVGAFIVLLLWLQLSSLMMLIGAQFNVTVGQAMRQRKP
jgi:membrane protein